MFHAVHGVLRVVSAVGKLCVGSHARCEPVIMTMGQMQLAGCSLLNHRLSYYVCQGGYVITGTCVSVRIFTYKLPFGFS